MNFEKEQIDGSYRYKTESEINVVVPDRYLLEEEPIKLASTRTNRPELIEKISSLIEHEQEKFKRISAHLKPETRDRMAERHIQAIKYILEMKE